MKPRITAVLALSLLLTGCGIQSTDVVEAGDPARAHVNAPAAGRMLLFFLSPNGELMPVTRSVGGPVEAGKTIAALLAGPVEQERAAGLDTALPRHGLPVRIEDAGDGVRVYVGFDVTGLSGSAHRQLVCTAAYAGEGDGLLEVTVVGTDGTLPPDRCR
ncbi:hypothetical protein GCM10020367_53070 [Streptomyces sannanensis]|uniref:GerMN domain-containing protein n=1 Tax=Streptomyces sannanensis TaxID=285536 RepID=A0ABP6SI15_9ACTN